MAHTLKRSGLGIALAMLAVSGSGFGPIHPETIAAQVQEMQVSSAPSPFGAPLTQDEIMARVRTAYSKALDPDDIAADIDRRGIDFAVESAYANKIKFFRAAVVSNALWRADDRRKALVARPLNPQTLEEHPEQDAPEFKNLPFIEQARVVALAYVSSLPNFVVREQVQRYLKQPSTPWKLGDYLEIEVSYVAERGEELKLKQKNGSSTNLTLDQIGGLTSTGQFAGQLASLFSPESKAEFVEQGKVNFYGQPCIVYSYRVAKPNSKQLLKVEKAQVVTGYRGQVYIHRDTWQVLRMEQESVEIPSDFPLTAASSTVDFGWVSLSDRDFLLPVYAQVTLTSKQVNTTGMNCIAFHKYSKFETDVKIVD